MSPSRFLLLLAALLSSLMLAACGGATPSPAVTPLPINTAAVAVEGTPTTANLEALLVRLEQDRPPLVQSSQLVPERPVVTVGGLPRAMPFALPLPEQTVIVGSVLRKNSLRGEGLILLDVPGSLAQLNAFFQAALAQQGFTPWMPGGPQNIQPTSSALLFCQRQKVIQLELDVNAAGQPAEVSLSYDTNPLVVSCNADALSATPGAEGILPNLTLPSDALLLSTGSSQGYQSWAYAQQNFLSPASPADLDGFLRPQLQQAGWQLVAESHTDPLAWSKWTRADASGRPWSGVLIITAGQGSQNSRVLLFQIERLN